MNLILIVCALLGAFLVYVSTRNGKFRYERSGVIGAPADKVFSIVSDLNQGRKWNPFAQKDPNMKSVVKGSGNTVGSVLEFDGNRAAGAGQLEILKLVPHQLVEIKLTMTKPFRAENMIEYRLTPEGAGIRFSWAMSGDGGFMGKLVNLFIDCDKMVAGEFEKGIANLKRLVEGA